MKPTIPEVLPLVNALYERHSAGCCLHAVLDDGNYEACHARGCLEYALEQKHADCIQVAKLLVQMSGTQRKKLNRIHI